MLPRRTDNSPLRLTKKWQCSAKISRWLGPMEAVSIILFEQSEMSTSIQSERMAAKSRSRRPKTSPASTLPGHDLSPANTTQSSTPNDQSAFTSRDRVLAACKCHAVDRPPVWLMRQAGRALPEYRALKEKHTFVELVQNPELATEVTLQPIRRFGFDAAILFSDILVVAEGLGQRYEFRDRGGIEMEFLIQSAADMDRLDVAAVTTRLQYVAKALPLVKSALDGRTALIGFAGSPWTLANFMIEGGGVKEYTKAKALFYSDPVLFGRLLDKLSRAVADFLQLQIDAGADAVQIFDSLGGALSDG